MLTIAANARSVHKPAVATASAAARRAFIRTSPNTMRRTLGPRAAPVNAKPTPTDDHYGLLSLFRALIASLM
jgi:hypothetical protein